MFWLLVISEHQEMVSSYWMCCFYSDIFGLWWTCTGLTAPLYMWRAWHVIASTGPSVWWIGVLELLNHRQTKSELQHSAPLPPLLSSPGPLSKTPTPGRKSNPVVPTFYLPAEIGPRCEWRAISASQQVSLKWPASRGHLAALRGAGRLLGWALAWPPVWARLALML